MKYLLYNDYQEGGSEGGLFARIKMHCLTVDISSIRKDYCLADHVADAAGPMNRTKQSTTTPLPKNHPPAISALLGVAAGALGL